jgi:hypothetical protein
MKVRISCSTEDGSDAARQLSQWVDGAEAGEMDGDELLSRLAAIAELVEAQTMTVRRALGGR